MLLDQEQQHVTLRGQGHAQEGLGPFDALAARLVYHGTAGGARIARRVHDGIRLVVLHQRN